MSESAKFCPFCGAISDVYNTRYFLGAIHRDRRCTQCKARWNTTERFVMLLADEEGKKTCRTGQE